MLSKKMLFSYLILLSITITSPLAGTKLPYLKQNHETIKNAAFFRIHTKDCCYKYGIIGRNACLPNACANASTIPHKDLTGPILTYHHKSGLLLKIINEREPNTQDYNELYEYAQKRLDPEAKVEVISAKIGNCMTTPGPIICFYDKNGDMISCHPYNGKLKKVSRKYLEKLAEHLDFSTLKLINIENIYRKKCPMFLM